MFYIQAILGFTYVTIKSPLMVDTILLTPEMESARSPHVYIYIHISSIHFWSQKSGTAI